MVPVILTFDTSAAHCAAALLVGDRIVASSFEPMDKGQAERLIPLCEDLLGAAGLGWRDLTAIAVGTGPGNFTGVRIAVAAARGLALSLGIPALGVTRLEAVAYGLPRPVVVVEDARRGEVYVQAFGAEPGAARLTKLDALDRQVRDFVGSAASLAAEATGGRAVVQPLPLTHAMAFIAAGRASGQPRPAPFYLRGADAAPPSDPPPVILP